MIFHILRFWISFFVPAFYRRIQIRNAGIMTAPGPTIIAMNHPNAFTDPIVITLYVLPHRLNYMARGDAFKPGFISWFLQSIGIVPIFRIQDGGKEGLKKNDDAYRRVNYLLSRGEKVIVFAEGLCIQERRLRPLKKGVARMVFGAWEAIKDDSLRVVPVGVNYSQPEKIGSDVFYNIGEPLLVKDFLPEYSRNPARAYNLLLQALEPEMKKLITHIDNPDNDLLVLRAETLYKHALMAKKDYCREDLHHDFLALSEITEKINAAERNSPELFEQFKTLTHTYFEKLDELKLKDWLLDPSQAYRRQTLRVAGSILLLLLTLPFALTGILFNLPPFLLSRFVTGKIVKNVEFYSSFFLGIAMAIFLVFYLIYFISFFCIAGSTFLAFLFVVIAGCCGAVAHQYIPRFGETRDLLRFFGKKKSLESLARQRKEAIGLINKF